MCTSVGSSSKSQVLFTCIVASFVLYHTRIHDAGNDTMQFMCIRVSRSYASRILQYKLQTYHDVALGHSVGDNAACGTSVHDCWP